VGYKNNGQVSSYDDVVDSTDMQDYYKFRLHDKLSIAAKLYNLTDDANLQLRDSDGTLISASGRTGTTYELITRVLKPGTYFLRVLLPGTHGTAYRLRLATLAPASALPEPPDSAGNEPSSARSLGKITPGRVSISNDSVGPDDSADDYRIRLDQPMKLSIKLDGLSGDADLELLSSSGHVLNVSERFGTKYELIARNLNAGTYYVVVHPKTDATASYKLRIAG
jgi:hypothetical protein